MDYNVKLLGYGYANATLGQCNARITQVNIQSTFEKIGDVKPCILNQSVKN